MSTFPTDPHEKIPFTGTLPDYDPSDHDRLTAHLEYLRKSAQAEQEHQQWIRDLNARTDRLLNGSYQEEEYYCSSCSTLLTMSCEDLPADMRVCCQCN